jgi:IPT/TIG domain
LGRKVFLAVLVIVSVGGVWALPTSASTPKPTIKSFSPNSGTDGTEVTIKGTYLGPAAKVTFSGRVAKVVSDAAAEIMAYVPAGSATGYIKVITPGGTARSVSKFRVLAPLSDAVNVVSDGDGYCAVLTSGGVDCWGRGDNGELGNGKYYPGPSFGSATPVAVEGIGGSGTLSGVTNLVGGGGDGYCALLTSDEVDCWGYSPNGELGNGSFSESATPVAVEGIGGAGTLT